LKSESLTAGGRLKLEGLPAEGRLKAKALKLEKFHRPACSADRHDRLKARGFNPGIQGIAKSLPRPGNIMKSSRLMPRRWKE